jgi:hypothetical protein
MRKNISKDHIVWFHQFFGFCEGYIDMFSIIKTQISNFMLSIFFRLSVKR